MIKQGGFVDRIWPFAKRTITTWHIKWRYSSTVSEFFLWLSHLANYRVSAKSRCSKLSFELPLKLKVAAPRCNDKLACPTDILSCNLKSLNLPNHIRKTIFRSKFRWLNRPMVSVTVSIPSNEQSQGKNHKDEKARSHGGSVKVYIICRTSDIRLISLRSCKRSSSRDILPERLGVPVPFCCCATKEKPSFYFWTALLPRGNEGSTKGWMNTDVRGQPDFLFDPVPSLLLRTLKVVSVVARRVYLNSTFCFFFFFFYWWYVSFHWLKL